MLGFYALGELALGQSIAEAHESLVAEGGAFTVTGQNAFTAVGYVRTAEAGSYTLTGQAVTYGRVMFAGAASYTVSGVSSKVDRRRLMITFTRGGDNGII